MAESLKINIHGRGPDLVLLHGWAMHSGIWGGLVDLLAEQFRVHLVDLPGHGINRHTPLSPDLNEVADLILSKLPPAVWIGWSLGGLITLAAALRQPGRVKKALLVAATPCFSRSPGWDCGVDVAAQQAFADALENDFEGSLKQFWLQCFGANLIDESLHLLGKTSVLDHLPSKNTMQTGLHLLYGSNLLGDLSRCEVPTLFVGGTRDRTIKPESFARAAELMPAADSRLIQAAGHAPFISHEDRFMDIISEFYQGDLTA
jgi:pimeloyl-[acyl-carrier protein] methyl ester esterase